MPNLAITHEMGHAICQEKNERKADDDGEALREGRNSRTAARWQDSECGDHRHER